MDKPEEKQPITGEYPVLVALQGPMEGRRWLIKDSLILGRDADCTVSVDDRQVSRHHARIANIKGNCFLEDLGSKNGTFYNGKQVEEPSLLTDGDVVQVALIQKFAFYSSDATMPIEDIDPQKIMRSGKLILDRKSRRVWVGNKELIPPLSAAQFRLLYYLYEQPGKVISREDLIHAIWEEDDAVGISDQALDALIRRLRSRLTELDPKHIFIITIRGHGVRFEN